MVDISLDQIVDIETIQEPQKDKPVESIEPDQIVGFQPKDAIGTEGDKYKIDDDIPRLIPDDRTFYKRIKDKLFRESYAPAKAAAIATLHEKTGVSVTELDKNYDKLRHEIFGGMAPMDEIISDIGAVGLMGALIHNPLGTLTSVGTFLGVDEVKDFVVTKAKGEDYTVAGSAHVSELLPEHYPSRVKTAMDVLEFIGIAAASGGIGGISRKAVANSSWWRSLTNKERGLEVLNASARGRRAGMSAGQAIRNRVVEKGGKGSKEGDAYLSKMQDIYARGPKASGELLSEDAVVNKTFQNLSPEKRSVVYSTIFKNLTKKEQTAVLRKHKKKSGINFTKEVIVEAPETLVTPFQFKATAELAESLRMNSIIEKDAIAELVPETTPIFSDTEVASLIDLGVRYRTMDAMLEAATKKPMTKTDIRNVRIWNNFMAEHILSDKGVATKWEKNLARATGIAITEVIGKYDQFTAGAMDAEGKIIASKLTDRKKELFTDIVNGLEDIKRNATLSNMGVDEYLVSNRLATPKQASLVNTYLEQVINPFKESVAETLEPSPIKGDASKVVNMLRESRKAMEEAKKVKFHDITKELQKGITARDIKVRDALEAIPGGTARTALAEKILEAGAGSAADAYFKLLRPKVWGSLNNKERQVLDDLVHVRKELAIFERHPKRRVPTGVGHPADYEAYMVNAKQLSGLSDERFEVVAEAANTFNKAMQDMLEKKRINNAISEELHTILKDNFYSPTQWLRALDLYNEALRVGAVRNLSKPLTTVSELESLLQKSTGSKVGNLQAKTSGVQRLKGGMEGYQNLDSEELMISVVNETHSWIARNRAATALGKLADELPANHGVIRKPVIKEWRADEQGNLFPLFKKPPQGFKELFYFDEGQRMSVWTEAGFAEQWSNSILQNNQQWLKFLHHASGASTLKVMSTGAGAPLFGLTKGLAMDVPYSYFILQRHLDNGKMASLYSANPVKFSKEMASNLKTIFWDTVKQKGEFLKMVEEGGMQGTINMQGQARAHKFSKFGHGMELVNAFGNYINIRAEYLVRMANREQYKKAGYDSREATAMMRDALDYSQGGDIIKIVDNFVPYTNVGVQSTRKLHKTILKNMKQFKKTYDEEGSWKLDKDGLAAKIGILAGTASALYLTNKVLFPDAYNDESKWNKDNNYVLPTGFNFTDAKGNKHYVNLKIKKEPTLAPYMNLAELLAARAMGDKVEFERVLRGFMQSGVPIAEIPSVPIFDMIGTYQNNVNGFTHKQIYKGDPAGNYEWTPERTSELWFWLGKQLPGDLSPDRMKAAVEQVLGRKSLPVTAVENTYDAFFGKFEQEDQETLMSEWLLSNWRPGVISVTSESTPLWDKLNEDSKEAEGKRMLQNLTTDNYARRFLKAPAMTDEDARMDSKADIMNHFIDFLNTQDLDDSKRMRDRFQDFQTTQTFAHHGVWMMFQGTKDAKVRAENISSWKRTKSFEERSQIEQQLMWLRSQKNSFIPKSFNTKFWRSYFIAEQKADKEEQGK